MSTATHTTTNQLARALRRAAGDPEIGGTNVWVARAIRCFAILAVTTALVCGVGTGATGSEHGVHQAHPWGTAHVALDASSHR
jgi:hypothetical protein